MPWKFEQNPYRNEKDIEVSKKRLEGKKRIILTNTIIERSSVGTEELKKIIYDMSQQKQIVRQI